MNPETIMNFFKYSDLESEIVEGDVERVIYTAKNLQIIIYHFPPNKVFPLHSHDKHEQMGLLFKGKMGFKVGEKVRILKPGEWYYAPIGVLHHAWTLEKPSVLIDIFSPPREDLIKK